MANYYVDNVNGNDGNSGLSEVLAKATIASAVSAASSDDCIYIQAGSNYTLTSTITVTKRLKFEGYTTTPGARDGRPTITTATNSTNLFELGTVRIAFVHIDFTNTASVRAQAIPCTLAAGAMASDLTVYDCVFDGFSQVYTDYWGSLRQKWGDCVLKNCTTDGAYETAGTSGHLFTGCQFLDNTTSHFKSTYGSQEATFYRCVFDDAAKALYYSYNTGFTDIKFTFLNCTFYSTSGTAIDLDEATEGVSLVMIDNVFQDVGGYGVDTATSATVSDRKSLRVNNAFRSMTSGNYTGLSAGYNDVSLSADALTNPGSADYSPNSTAGGGALLRNAGTNDGDIGAVQHADAGGSSGGGPLFGGRLIG